MISTGFKGLIYTFIICVIITVVSVNRHSSAQSPQEVIVKKSDSIYLLKDIEINTNKKTVTIPCTVNMESGLLEVILCRPEGKTHESLLKTNVTPLEFQTALLLLGLDPVNELPSDPKDEDPLSPYLTLETPGDSVLIYLVTEENGKETRNRLENYIRDERTQNPLSPCGWIFRGAVTHRSNYVIVDPDVTMIATYHDPIALMELNNPDRYDDELFYVNTSAGLIAGQPVTLIIQVINQ